MRGVVRIVLVVVGLVMIVMGLQASEAFASEVSEFFTGSPTDRSIWLMIGGIVALLVGGFGFRAPKA